VVEGVVGREALGLSGGDEGVIAADEGESETMKGEGMALVPDTNTVCMGSSVSGSRASISSVIQALSGSVTWYLTRALVSK